MGWVMGVPKDFSDFEVELLLLDPSSENGPLLQKHNPIRVMSERICAGRNGMISSGVKDDSFNRDSFNRVIIISIECTSSELAGIFFQ